MLVDDHKTMLWGLQRLLEGAHAGISVVASATTLEFDLAGFISAQRTQDVPWQMYTQVDDVVLKAFDSKVTTIDHDSTAPIPPGVGTIEPTAEPVRNTTATVSRLTFPPNEWTLASSAPTRATVSRSEPPSPIATISGRRRACSGSRRKAD